jgi:hypothetical protein
MTRILISEERKNRTGSQWSHLGWNKPAEKVAEDYIVAKRNDVLNFPEDGTRVPEIREKHSYKYWREKLKPNQTNGTCDSSREVE